MHRDTLRLSLLLFSLSLIFVACASSESSNDACTNTNECSGLNEICWKGACVDRETPRECQTRAECLSNEDCIDGVCSSASTGDMMSTDMNMSDMVADTTTTDTATPDDMMADTSSSGMDTTPPSDLRDTVGPRIVSRSPDPDVNGAMEIALDATVTIQFDEEVVEGTITNGANLYIWDYSRNGALPATTSWDAQSLTATVTPSEPLGALSPYQVVLTSNVLDRAGNATISTEWSFYTTGDFTSKGFYQELAAAYAPTLHQDAVSNTLDVPLRLDFDGDLNMRNNGANALSGSGSSDPAVYYNVSETESHYFVHYILYYPIFQLSDGAPQYTHSTNGVLVLVRKTAERLGALQLVQTYSTSSDASNMEGRVDSFLPDCTGSMLPFCAAEVTAKTAGISITTRNITAANYADATDSRRVPLYVQPRRHSLCHFDYREPVSGYCARGGMDYNGSFHAVLTPAADGSTPTAPDFSSGTGSYGLYPLADLWWIQRASFGDTDDTFYLDTTSYEGSIEFSIAKDAPITVPRSLNSASDQRSNNPGRTSPFAWNVAGSGRGAWMVDPAYTAFSFFDMPAGEDYFFLASRDCYSLFAGIDRTDTDAACQPVAP